MNAEQRRGPVANREAETGTGFVALDDIQPRRGAEVLVEVLRSEGVRYVFGNPGTTELSFIDALTGAPDLSYVLGLQEAAVVAMADGYAQASGRPGFTNLHTVGGLGHAMGALLNAKAARTPLVVTAGQQDTRHASTDPLLYGDSLGVAGPAVKWAREVVHPDEIGMLVRRAFNDSAAAPSGPVFLSLPMDVMERTTSVPVPRRSSIDRASIPSALPDLAKALASIRPGRLAIVVGDEVFAAGASAETVTLAETLGALVYGPSWPAHLPFPTSHALWRGNLPMTAAGMHETLRAFDAVFVLGGHFSITILYSIGPAIPSTCRLYQLASDPQDLGRIHATALGCVGALRASLQALAPLLCEASQHRRAEIDALHAEAQRDRTRQRVDLDEQVASGSSAAMTTPLVAAHEIARALGPTTPLVDESPATMPLIRSALHSGDTRQYYGTRGAILGWGMGAAVGVSLGLGRAPVVAVIGDGSALYAPQALWTAAHECLPVTFVVVNNQEYNILKKYMKSQTHFVSAHADRFVGMDLKDPPIDFLALAKSWGLAARRVARAEDIAVAVECGIASGQPNLIEIPVSAT
ncbi:thiamine pyrophosphate-binding protein [Burkholderia cenocepacia]|uniref:thiamine pyrophosphate-binding protein n=1 Tax=Burkholderia cenocepacia TaxID=95486 RepID=UPI000F578CBA|nr:thiamine pyrophosphate-binding protein [Burkholderia cenocepacia]RQU32780.1 thiamine pyrophosphate-binding protein [Burkholderia cenocepacia]RQU56993.1 thiamine pyrophosphate-binding protein [Burkholderia cenocepacia]